VQVESVCKKNNLKALRERYGIVQQEISVVGSVSGGTLVAIEKHGLYPTPETRGKILNALNLLTVQQRIECGAGVITESDIWPENKEDLCIHVL
jgi:DNA-binding XRE family transcriptional regulator